MELEEKLKYLSAATMELEEKLKYLSAATDEINETINKISGYIKRTESALRAMKTNLPFRKKIFAEGDKTYYLAWEKDQHKNFRFMLLEKVGDDCLFRPFIECKVDERMKFIGFVDGFVEGFTDYLNKLNEDLNA
jgi:CII-binding regulator of phage lambda lysogenization HflD